MDVMVPTGPEVVYALLALVLSVAIPVAVIALGVFLTVKIGRQQRRLSELEARLRRLEHHSDGGPGA